MQFRYVLRREQENRWCAPILLVLGAFCVLGCSEADPDRPGAARISLEHEVTLGSPEDPASPTNLAQVAWWEGAGFAVAPLYRPGAIGLYDGAGRWMRSVGREGNGPGEFTDSPVFLLRPMGDSLWANSVPQRSITVFGPSGENRSTILLPAPAAGFQPISRDIFLLGLRAPADSVLLLARSTGAIRRLHFPRPSNEVHVLGPSRDAAWIALRTPYDLLKVDGEGERLQRITRAPPSGSDLVPAEATLSVTAIREDDDGVWIVSQLEDPGDLPEDLEFSGDWDDRFDTLVELVDPRSGQTRAVHRDDRALSQVFGGPMLSQTVYTAVGDRRIRIYSIGLDDTGG